MFGWLFGKKKKENNKMEYETGKVPWYSIPSTFDIKEHHQHKSKRHSESTYSGEDSDAWLSRVKNRSNEIKKKKKRK